MKWYAEFRKKRAEIANHKKIIECLSQDYSLDHCIITAQWDTVFK